MRLDDLLALRRQFIQVLGETFDDAAATRSNAWTVFFEVGLASRAFGCRLCQGNLWQKQGCYEK
jgi:hypothetical protein